MEEEQSIFVEALGSSPVIKILDFLITGDELDFSLSNITEGADVGWMTVHRILPKLLKLGIVKHTREIGRAKMYQINDKNPIAQKLIELDNFLMSKAIEDFLEKEQIKVVA